MDTGNMPGRGRRRALCRRGLLASVVAAAAAAINGCSPMPRPVARARASGPAATAPVSDGPRPTPTQASQRRAPTPAGRQRASQASTPTPMLAPPPAPTSSPTSEVVRYVARGPAVRRAPHVALPVRLRIPKLGVDAPMVAVGLAPDGAMDIPQKASDVAWYRLGPAPGTRGNAVLAGHLDWMGARGVFARLHELGRGDQVVVRGANDVERRYAVQWINEWRPGEAPIATVFEPTVPAALTLITCGGQFDRATQQYETRVVVRAIEV